MKIRSFGGSAMLVTAIVFSPTRAAGAPCESLAALTLPDTTITSAQTVAVGAFTPPGGLGFPEAVMARFRASVADLPAFCRGAATLRPTSDSDIKIEVWMPSSGWNGKFLGVGNGGWAGTITYPALTDALRRGYAAASTDTGHTGRAGDASFALGHPEKLTDFGYRAVHEMTVTAKAIIADFYEDRPRFSYWNGCSTGGKQGLTEAQRFPDDYDGIVAGAPANFWTHLMTGLIWVGRATLSDPASYIPPNKYPVLNRAVLDACDMLDGVNDGVLEDPTRCRFDPQVLECEGADGPTCLTAPQVAAAQKIYGPATNPRTGEAIFPGLSLGSELGWRAAAGGPEPTSIPVDHFKYVVFEDPDWDFRTFDFDRDVALTDARDGGLLNATDPNLQPFVERGGKLILYHGWNDPLIAPQNTVDYYNDVVSTLGDRSVEDSIRLFMAPGMNHCRGGVGPGQIDPLGALETWVEDGRAPDWIIASRVVDGEVDRTRPLCPYPQVAQYTGYGSTDDADNFVCVSPEPSR